MICECPKCLMRVFAQSDGACPSCGSQIQNASEVSINLSQERLASRETEKVATAPSLTSAERPFTNVEQLASLRVQLLEAFDAIWQVEQPNLKDFVARIPEDFNNGNGRRDLLVALVKRDLEYRWGQAKRIAATSDMLTMNDTPILRFTLDEYATRFPDLKSDGVMSAKLKVAEFQARRGVGEQLHLDDYIEPGSSHPDQVAAELAAELVGSMPARPTACSNLFAALAACVLLTFVSYAVIYVKTMICVELGLRTRFVVEISLNSLTIFSVGLFILLSAHGRDSRQVISIRAPGRVHALLTLLLVLPTLIVVMFIACQFMGTPQLAMASSFEFNLDAQFAALAMEPWLLAIFAGSILPAISEEIFFRGLLGRGLIRGHGIVAGVLITSLLFGLLHLDPTRIPGMFVLGLVLHLVYLTTKSILAPMLLHALNNIVALMMSRYSELGSFEPTQGDGILYLPPSLVICSCFAVLMLLAVLGATRTKWIVVNPIQWSAGFLSAESPPALVHARVLRRKSDRWLNGACVVTCIIFGCSLGSTAVTWTALTYGNAAVARAEKEDLETAKTFSQRAVAIRPDLAWTHACQAWVSFRSKAQNEALAACEKSLELDPTLIFAFVTRAKIMVAQEKFDSAISDCGRALQHQPRNSDAFVTRANAWLGKNQPDKAIKDANAALEFAPSYVFALLPRGQAYVKLGEYDLAIDDFTKFLDAIPGDVFSLIWRSIARRESSDITGAIADTTRVLEIDPQNTSALYERALTYVREKRFENALADVSNCITLGGEDTDFLFTRSAILLEMDKPIEALVDLKALIVRFPEDWTFRVASAEAFRKSGDHQRAQDEERIASDLQISEQVQLAWQDIQLQNGTGALARIDRAIEQFPTSSDLYVVQAVARASLQQYDAAIDAYTSALKFTPDNAALVLERGKMHFENRALYLALTDLDRAIEMEPGMADAYYWRGMVHQTLGNKEKAQRDFNTSEGR